MADLLVDNTSRTYYRELGPMKRDEKICSILFKTAMLAAFTRPLYADILPGLAPDYVYLTLGCLCFFITAADKGFLLKWEEAQKGMMWGMMILFAGGMALGKLINDSGATARIADIVSNLALDGGLLTVVVLVIFTRMISEVTNGTTAAAHAICKVIYDNAEMLGPMVAEETRLGRAADKITKCRMKSALIWNSLKGKKSVGIINRIEDRRMIEIAKPMGVVASQCLWRHQQLCGYGRRNFPGLYRIRHSEACCGEKPWLQSGEGLEHI